MSAPPAERSAVLLAVAQAVAAHSDLAALLRDLAHALCDHVRLDYLSFSLVDPTTRVAELQLLQPVGLARAPDPADTPTQLPAHESPTALVWDTQQPLWLTIGEADRRFPTLAAALRRQGVRVVCFVPLSTPRRRLGAMAFTSYQDVCRTDDDLDFLSQISRLVALAVEAALSRRELEQANELLRRERERLAQEKLYLEEEIRTERRFDEIIGEGPALRAVLRQVELVAPTDSTVLILGETGTGKELIARAIHRLSQRRDRTFVKLNCAAIPTGLLESELFGHEKGAFTGAVERRIGRFELADGGTLFLDEVGDIPLELQPKLLRVLQEQELERLGSGKTIQVNVRLVAATHRNLDRMVASGAFRSDLFYRLHVFPIRLPPLRERREDIPDLVRHFARTFARRIGKVIDTIPAESLAALQAYDWPGNVRELEHLIERAVILSPGPVLRVPLGDLRLSPPGASPLTLASRTGTLQDAERELIRRTLEECRWVVGGRNGAAARLGLKRTTLLARMKKLGLRRPPDREVSIG
ncbi:MAG TPA: sigma 54-interacting transcriptional regulator [Gemmataceae bacterium]|nr:sigma 54-interacting transcriptional regulator [Gemmataceae bacterium]